MCTLDLLYIAFLSFVTRVSILETMYESSRVNVKVEPCSTLTFTCDTSYFASVSFTGVKFTWRSTLSLLATRREDDGTKKKKFAR